MYSAEQVRQVLAVFDIKFTPVELHWICRMRFHLGPERLTVSEPIQVAHIVGLFRLPCDPLHGRVTIAEAIG